jgi:hypothetical protein
MSLSKTSDEITFSLRQDRSSAWSTTQKTFYFNTSVHLLSVFSCAIEIDRKIVQKKRKKAEDVHMRRTTVTRMHTMIDSNE